MRPLQLLSSFLLGALFFTAVAVAWTGPSQTAPNGNVSAPINVGTTDQVKNANIGVNGLAVFGNSILQASSYLNWGTIAGTSGYGIRDTSGTLEFKNLGSSWANLNTTVQNYLSLGAVTQIKFSDGTTQTTAAGASTPAGAIGGGCDGSGNGWGNQTGCSSIGACNAYPPYVSCPSGYTARRTTSAGTLYCTDDGENGCCSNNYWVTRYWAYAALCIKN